MSSSQLPNTAIPKPLPDDDDDVSWALQTAAVQWGRGAHQDAIVWLRRAAETAIELSSWSRAADLNATATRLEKQISKHPAPTETPGPSGLPSAPPRAAILPSFPVPNTAAPPSMAPLTAVRQTTGYSSFPPLSGQSSQRPSSSARSSVVIDVDEEELELSEDEIRELESSSPALDIPSGARPSQPNWQAAVSRRSTTPDASSNSLPAFSLDSSRPRHEPVARSSATSGLPAFPSGAAGRAPGARQSSVGPAASVRPAGTESRNGAVSDLPSFPFDPSASTLPPVSKWPRHGSPGTSHLPPTPGLPVFEAVPPSRPFVDDGDDGAPGLGDLALLDDQAIQELEPMEQLEPITESEPIEEAPAQDGLELELTATSSSLPPPPPQEDHLELLELEGPRSSRKPAANPRPLPHIEVRLGRGSGRQRGGAAPLPPAVPPGKLASARPRLPRIEPRPIGDVPALAPASRASPPLPALPRLAPPNAGGARGSEHSPASDSTASPEPRMPKRTFSYAPPLDFSDKTERSARSEPRASVRPTSETTTRATPASSRASAEGLIDGVEPKSVAPPQSARSIEPEDLPTVSSPSLSRPPPTAEVASRLSERASEERAEVASRQPERASEARAEVASRRPERASEGVPSEPQRSAVETRIGEHHSSPVPPGERRRLNFKFEEPKVPTHRPAYPLSQFEASEAARTESISEQPPDASPASADPDLSNFANSVASAIATEPLVEEPLAELPRVVTRPVAESKAPAPVDVMISGVRLAEVRGFSELSVAAHQILARTARIEALATGEEASFFSVALVLEGWVGLMPAIADTACATAVVGEVVFTEGTLTDGLMLRVVAGQDDVVVATWDSAAIAEATKDCPWVADDLRLLADGFQALAGACLGPLGDRLDDSLRSIVTSRCEIRTLLPGEQLCAANKIVPGMHIIGGGEVELVDENARVTKTYGSGEFLFAPQVLAGGVAPYSARAGIKGALVLFAPRMSAHELLVSVPPLLEILAE